MSFVPQSPQTISSSDKIVHADVISQLCYPYPFEPVDLVVEQNLSVWQVDVAVVSVVQEVSE